MTFRDESFEEEFDAMLGDDSDYGRQWRDDLGVVTEVLTETRIVANFDAAGVPHVTWPVAPRDVLTRMLADGREREHYPADAIVGTRVTRKHTITQHGPWESA